MTRVNNSIYLKIAKQVDLKSSHKKIVTMWDDEC